MELYGSIGLGVPSNPPSSSSSSSLSPLPNTNKHAASAMQEVLLGDYRNQKVWARIYTESGQKFTFIYTHKNAV